MLAHVLDFDDLHMESTSHVSAVCVPAVLAAGGDAHAYLAGAGRHGPPGHARWAGRTTPRAGTRPAPPGHRAAAGRRRTRWGSAPTRWPRRWRSRCRRPAACSARSARRPRRCRSVPRRRPACAPRGWPAPARRPIPRALDQWLALVGGDAGAAGARRPRGPRRAGRQALPLLLRAAAPDRRAARARRRPRARSPAWWCGRRRARSPRSSTPRRRPAWRASSACSTRSRPHCSTAGPGSRASPTRPSHGPRRRRCWRAWRSTPRPGGDWLLAGDVAIEVTLDDGSTLHAQLDLPPGAPDRPPSEAELAAKVADCAGDLADEILAVDWLDAGAFLRERLPARSLPRA